MAEHIEREAAIAKIREEGVYGSGYSNEEREDNVVDMLTSIPAADVRPVVQHVHTDECREMKITYVDTSEDLIKSLRVCGKSLEAAAFPEWDICLYTRAANAIEERERLIDAQLSIIKQYQEYLKKEWIPVTERLPGSGVPTLICGDGNVVEQGFFDDEYGYWYDCGGNRTFVHHWMPLPEPPKEGKNND